MSTSKKPIKAKDLEEYSGISAAVIKALVDKEIFEFYHIQTDRISYEGDTNAFRILLSEVTMQRQMCKGRHAKVTM